MKDDFDDQQRAKNANQNPGAQHAPDELSDEDLEKSAGGLWPPAHRNCGCLDRPEFI